MGAFALALNFFRFCLYTLVYFPLVLSLFTLALSLTYSLTLFCSYKFLTSYSHCYSLAFALLCCLALHFCSYSVSGLACFHPLSLTLLLLAFYLSCSFSCFLLLSLSLLLFLIIFLPLTEWRELSGTVRVQRLVFGFWLCIGSFSGNRTSIVLLRCLWFRSEMTSVPWAFSSISCLSKQESEEESTPGKSVQPLMRRGLGGAHSVGRLTEPQSLSAEVCGQAWSIPSSYLFLFSCANTTKPKESCRPALTFQLISSRFLFILMRCDEAIAPLPAQP